LSDTPPATKDTAAKTAVKPNEAKAAYVSLSKFNAALMCLYGSALALKSHR
jgi:hypothetical protein